MDLSILRNEIATDPLDLGYAAMTDEAVAAALNDPVVAIYGEVPLVEVLRELIMLSDENGKFVWDSVLAAAADDQHAGHDLARRLQFLFESNLPINWGGDAANSLMQLSIAAGFFTSAQAETLKDTGRRLVSRGAQLTIGWVRPGEVGEARHGE